MVNVMVFFVVVFPFLLFNFLNSVRQLCRERERERKTPLKVKSGVCLLRLTFSGVEHAPSLVLADGTAGALTILLQRTRLTEVVLAPVSMENATVCGQSNVTYTILTSGYTLYIAQEVFMLHIYSGYREGRLTL